MSGNEHLISALSSLKIDRGAAKKGLPGWALPALGAALLLGLGLFTWRFLAERVFVPTVETTTISVVTQSQAEQLLVATGYVVPQTKANLSPRTGGRVARILIEDGTEVKKGQLIAVLEDADTRAQLAQAQADRASAQAQIARAQVELEDAQRAFDREAMLQAKQVSTPQAKDNALARLGGAQANLGIAKANHLSAQARVKVAQVNLDNCYVRAPFAGRITQKLTDVGEIVFGAVGAGGGGNGGIATLADFRTLMVEADVNESQVAKLKAGTPTEITLDAFPGRTFRGKVHELRPKVDRAKATVTVKVAFLDPVTGVLPDMGSKVTFLAKELDAKAAEARPTPAVQASAVAASGENKIVWVIGEGGAVQSVPVITGAPIGGLLSLQSGPPPGTKVVQRPSQELRAGMRVKEKQ